MPASTYVLINGVPMQVTDNGDGTYSLPFSATLSGGTAENPFRIDPMGSTAQPVTQATHDNLQANANLQVGDADVGPANPVPVSDGVVGAKTDVPFDGTEDATARSGVSLWKGIKNYLLAAKSVLGVTNGAAIITDAEGTVQQYLRGLVKLLVNKVTVRLDEGANTIGNTKDAGTAFTTSLGVGGARVTSADMSGAAVAITDLPASGQKIVVDDIIFSADAAMRIDFSEETSGTIAATVYLAANSSGQITTRGRLKLAAADKKLQARSSSAGNVAITALYHSEP